MFRVQIVKKRSNTIYYVKCIGAVACVAVLAGCGTGGSSNNDLIEAILDHGVLPVEAPSEDADRVALGRVLFFDKELSGNRDISCATCHHPTLNTADGLSLSIGTGGDGLGPNRSIPLDDFGTPIFIPRNAPEAFNRDNFHTMFWDGRIEFDELGELITPVGEDLLPGLSTPLEAQAMFPVTSRDEMRGQVGESELGDLADDDFVGMWDALMTRLLVIDEYRTLFANACNALSIVDS